MSIYKGNVKASLTTAMNVKKTYPDGTNIGTIKPGASIKADDLKIDGTGVKWYHIFEVNGVTPSWISGWGKETYLENMTIVDPNPPPPPAPIPDTFTVRRTESVTNDATGEVWTGTSITVLTKQT